MNALIADCLDTDEGDAGAVRVLLSEYADKHFEFTASDAKKIIKVLKRKRNKFKKTVSKEDLDRVWKELDKKFEKLVLARTNSGSPTGPISPQTSPVIP